MITTTVMGSNVHVVWATERTDVIDVQSFSEKKFQTGTYIVKNSTEYIESICIGSYIKVIGKGTHLKVIGVRA